MGQTHSAKRNVVIVKRFGVVLARESLFQTLVNMIAEHVLQPCFESSYEYIRNKLEVYTAKQRVAAVFPFRVCFARSLCKVLCAIALLVLCHKPVVRVLESYTTDSESEGESDEE
jgi:hypothetical protein